MKYEKRKKLEKSEEQEVKARTIIIKKKILFITRNVRIIPVRQIMIGT